MYQIVIRKKDWNVLSTYLTEQTDIESAAYACFRLSRSPVTTKILVNQILIPRDNDYLERSSGSVVMHPQFTEKAFQAAEKIEGHLLDIHTHPWSRQVEFSSIDDREATKTKIPYLAKYLPQLEIAFIVFGQSNRSAKARHWNKRSYAFNEVARIVII